MAKKKKKKSHFGLGMLIYGILLIGVGIAGLYLLNDFLIAYEESRPETALNAYMDTLSARACDEIAADFLSSLDPEINPAEDGRALINGKFQNARAKKAVTECTDDRLVYAICSGDEVLGKASFKKSARNDFDLSFWELEGEEYEFDSNLSSMEITAPSNCIVKVGEHVLTEAEAVETGIKLDELSDFDGSYGPYFSNVPTLTHYALSGFIGEPAVAVIGPDGSFISDSDVTWLVDDCDSTVRERLNAHIQGFIPQYVNYSANKDWSLDYYYGQVVTYLLPGSPIAQRVLAAKDGLFYSQTRGAEVSDLTLDKAVSLGNGYYYCRISYHTDIIFGKEKIAADNDVKLILTDDGASCLVCDMIL